MKRLFYALPLIVLAVVSCGKEGTMITDEICFTAEGSFEAEVKTRATAEVTSLASFSVNAVSGTMGSSETSVFNAVFDKDGSGSDYKGGKYWPSTDQSYKFYASNVSMTPASGGPTIAATNATDAVCAVLSNPTYRSSNQLKFNHVFARIGSCNISAPDGYAVSDLAVKITPKTGGTYNLYTGDGKTDGTGWSDVSTGVDTVIASGTGSTADNGLYLIPGNYTLTATYTLAKGDYTESFTKTASVDIVGGKVNNISAALPAGNAEQITFTVSVAAWGTNDITATLI